jgi:ornithine cyclodeaminase/alanine dehydrogenase-like protein (mu-crystallin family)
VRFSPPGRETARWLCHTERVVPTAAPVRMLTRSQVRSLLRWPELIEAAGQALVEADRGRSSAASVQLPVPGASVHVKAGALVAPPVISVKANLRPDAGGSAGLIVAFDPVRHTVRAVLDSADITAMRTAAVAAVAARALAGPGRHRLAVVGAGPVAQHAITALAHVIEVGEIQLWSRDRARAEQVAATLGVPVKVCSSPQEAVHGAGVILTATPSREPVLPAGRLTPDALVLAMGADSPGKRELGEGVLDGARLVADAPDDAFRVGELAYLPATADRSRCAGLGELLAGRRELPRGGRIIFDSVGTAVADAAAVGLVVDSAERADVGMMIAFSA